MSTVKSLTDRQQHSDCLRRAARCRGGSLGGEAGEELEEDEENEDGWILFRFSFLHFVFAFFCFIKKYDFCLGLVVSTYHLLHKVVHYYSLSHSISSSLAELTWNIVILGSYQPPRYPCLSK